MGGWSVRPDPACPDAWLLSIPILQGKDPMPTSALEAVDWLNRQPFVVSSGNPHEMTVIGRTWLGIQIFRADEAA